MLSPTEQAEVLSKVCDFLAENRIDDAENLIKSNLKVEKDPKKKKKTLRGFRLSLLFFLLPSDYGLIPRFKIPFFSRIS